MAVVDRADKEVVPELGVPLDRLASEQEHGVAVI